MTKHLTVSQICCADDTQFADRMVGCEDTAHSAAGAVACVGKWCPDLGLGLGLGLFTGSLDGVVRISYDSKHFEPVSEMVQYIGNADQYISDHNGVNLIVDARHKDRPAAQFNIITQNFEGLCYRDDPGKMDRFEYVREHLKEHFRDYLRKGSILLAQELALQLHKKDAVKQIAVLEHNMDVLLTQLRSINPDLVGNHDGYTGGMFYDQTIWLPVKEFRVNRIGSNKYSNAYLMRFLPYPNLHLWIVNVHLKAFGSAVKSQASVNQAHVNELSNILDVVISDNKEEYPVYLCGDFNNGTAKSTLVINAIKQLPIKVHIRQ